MGGVEVLLDFPGQAPGDLAHDLTQQVIAAALHQALGQEANHRRKLDPDAQVQLPAHISVGKPGDLAHDLT